MIDSKTLAEWRYAATEMHLPPTWEQAVRLIEEVERLQEMLEDIAALKEAP
jgi:hypothetical protein